jgi:hypothetical protein
MIIPAQGIRSENENFREAGTQLDTDHEFRCALVEPPGLW